MFGVDLRKLKPSFGGGGGGSSQELDGSDRDGNTETTKDDPRDDDKERQELFGPVKKSKKPKSIDEKATSTEETTSDDLEAEGDTEVVEEEDLDRLLENMTIPDFNLSVCFPQTGPASHGDAKESATTTGDECSSRLNREEVFSKKYHPSKTEKAELEAVAAHLGVSASMGIRLTASSTCIHQLLYGNHSIILKRGPIDFNDNDCELILLTDGFILAYRKFNSYNPLGSRYEACHSWSDVEFVEIAKAGTFTIQIRSGESYGIHAVTGGEHIKNWLQDTEHVLIQHAMRDPSLSTFIETFGWQYKLIRRPGYTTAVTSDMKLMGNPGDHLNQLDTHNKSTPLHYALRQSPCHAHIVEALLRLGSDPGLADGDGRTAMYFAQRDKMTDIEALLKAFGGKPSRMAEMELRGELFGGVEEATRNNEKRREREQAFKDRKAADAASKAESAQSEMGKAMSALVERGQKIEQMDDKARELNNEAKNFADLAKQLKGEMKNKKWYNF
jgi:Synaptobrevin